MAVSNLSNGSGIIQAQGIGSGLDIPSLVSQLVSAEGAPEQARLTRKSAQVATQLSAMGTLKGALASFQASLSSLKDTTLFQVLTAKPDDDAIFTATAGTAAVAGHYDVTITQLASADKLVSTPVAGGATTPVGTGSLSLTLGTTTMTLNITSTNGTLAGIRDAINSASNNPGVQATLVYGLDGAHLVLGSTHTGAANTLRISSSGGNGGLASLNYAGGTSPNYTVATAAADAIASVSGVVVHSATNVMTGAIDGVDLQLKTADPGVTHTLDVASDQSSVISRLQQFVDGYNNMRGKFATLSFYNTSTKTAGPMLGDPMFAAIDSQMRRFSLNEVSGTTSGYSSLSAIGITTGSDGKLTLDATKVRAALDKNSGAVAALFGATNGIAKRLDTALTNLLAGDGPLASRDKSLAQDNKALDTQKQNLDKRLTSVQQRYLVQFNALDSLMAQMKQTSTFLAQQLGSTSTTA